MYTVITVLSGIHLLFTYTIYLGLHTQSSASNAAVGLFHLLFVVYGAMRYHNTRSRIPVHKPHLWI